MLWYRTTKMLDNNESDSKKLLYQSFNVKLGTSRAQFA